jgi:hypothetical protein
MRFTASTPSGGAVSAGSAGFPDPVPDADPDPEAPPSFFDPHPVPDAAAAATSNTHTRFPIIARRIHSLMAVRARSACVVVGATPSEVAALRDTEPEADFQVRSNRHGALLFGRLSGLPIELADAFDGPVYDIMYNPTSGWFSVTVFKGVRESPVRYDNRPDEEAGYPRVGDILGATSPPDILEALDVPAEVIGYVLA